MPEDLGVNGAIDTITVNMKNLNGPLHPDRKNITSHDMIADVSAKELEDLGNPIDYFNIYKKKM